MEVRIANGVNSITLSFNELDYNKFIEAVKRCLDGSQDYIQYEDKSDKIIFSAEYLKRSFITMPKRDW